MITQTRITPDDQARLVDIKRQLHALSNEIHARPVAPIEQRMRDDMAELASGLALFGDAQLARDTARLIAGLGIFRMTDDDRRREAALFEQWNAIVTPYRQARRDARQARVNAREVAAVRAAACPRCFATHAGDC